MKIFKNFINKIFNRPIWWEWHQLYQKCLKKANGDEEEADLLYCIEYEKRERLNEKDN